MIHTHKRVDEGKTENTVIVNALETNEDVRRVVEESNAFVQQPLSMIICWSAFQLGERLLAQGHELALYVGSINSNIRKASLQRLFIEDIECAQL